MNYNIKTSISITISTVTIIINKTDNIENLNKNIYKLKKMCTTCHEIKQLTEFH